MAKVLSSTGGEEIQGNVLMKLEGDPHIIIAYGIKLLTGNLFNNDEIEEDLATATMKPLYELICANDERE